MEVLLQHYKNKPRLRLSKLVEIPEPQTNDIMIIPKEWFAEIGKEYKNQFGSFKMRVEGREINCCYYKGTILTIYLKLES